MFKFTKKFFATAALLSTMFFAGGVGHCNAINPDYSADKAVLGYAEAYAFNSSKHIKETGLATKDLANNQIILDEVADFGKMPFSDASLAKIKATFESKFENLMNIKVTLKKNDPEHPVVTLTANVMDKQSVDKQLEQQDGLQAIILMTVGAELADNKTPDQVKADKEIQGAFVEVGNSAINALTAGQIKSIDITCKKIKGADGNAYWAPEAPAAVMNFVQGK